MSDRPKLARAKRLIGEMKTGGERLERDSQRWRVVREFLGGAVEGCTLDEASRLLDADVVFGALTVARVLGATSMADNGEISDVYRADVLAAELRDRTKAALEAGHLVATAYSDASPLDAPPIRIPPQRWSSVEIDWERNTVDGAGGVRVYNQGANLPPGEGVSVSPRRPPSKTLELAYLEWVEENVAQGRTPTVAEEEVAMVRRLGAKPSRAALRNVRERHAPSAWKKPGTRSPRR